MATLIPYKNLTILDSATQSGGEAINDNFIYIADELEAFDLLPASAITSTQITNWDTAYGWGDHAGLYDLTGTASGLVSGHESTYNHSLIATALQSETDPVFTAWLGTSPLASYVPYSGATGGVTLGSYGLTANGGLNTLSDSNGLIQGAGSDVTINYTGTYWDFNILKATTSIRFNNAGFDTDFIISGDTVSNLFVLDAGNDRITINCESVCSNFGNYRYTVYTPSNFPNSPGDIIPLIIGGSTQSVMAFACNSSSYDRKISGYVKGDDNGHLAFGSKNATLIETGGFGSSYQRMAVDNNGRVGINDQTLYGLGGGSGRTTRMSVYSETTDTHPLLGLSGLVDFSMKNSNNRLFLGNRNVTEGESSSSAIHWYGIAKVGYPDPVSYWEMGNDYTASDQHDFYIYDYVNTCSRFYINNDGVYFYGYNGKQMLGLEGNYLLFGDNTVDENIIIYFNGTSGGSSITWAYYYAHFQFADDIFLEDGENLKFGTTTGSVIGSTTNQKLAFWNAIPIVQPTTGIGSSTLAGGGGTNITDTHTFDGYTLKQVVKALRNLGLLA